MANVREIRNRMDSIRDIMKITNAMYLISSSKLKKARKSLEDTLPYFNRIQETILHILKHTADVEHAFFDVRPSISQENRQRGYIVITADKGLAGSYNHNVLKLAEESMTHGDKDHLYVVGQLGRMYFAHKRVQLEPDFLYTAQNPTLYRARSIAETVCDQFLSGQLDEVYVIYTKMVSPVKSEPQILRLLPLTRDNFTDTPSTHHHTAAVFSPSPERVINHLVPDYLKGLLYSILVEAFASEQNARMTAMDSATQSARDMIRILSLQYNRARQAAITQEITEIVGGANCLNSGDDTI